MTGPQNLVKYVALLRGINVGGRGLVSMKALKASFDRLGFEDVSTYINSGNIIFTDARKDIPALVRFIEAGIKTHHKMDVTVVVRSRNDMAAICRRIPAEWVTDQAMRTDVMFLRDEVDTPKVMSTLSTNPDVDRLVYVKGAVIWNVLRKEYGKSRLPKIIGTSFYRNMTARNANTTRKLLELMSLRERI